MTTSYILKWGTSCTVASNFLEKQLIFLNDQWSLPWQALKPTRAWALVFIFPAKPFLWSCPTFDVFFVKYHSFSANLAKYALAPQLQLKGWVKDLGFFLRVGGKTFQRHSAIFSIPDFDISFMVCLISEEGRFLDAKMPLVTNAVNIPETLKGETSWSAEVSGWHAVWLSCQDPKWILITIKCKLVAAVHTEFLQLPLYFKAQMPFQTVTINCLQISVRQG